MSDPVTPHEEAAIMPFVHSSDFALLFILVTIEADLTNDGTRGIADQHNELAVGVNNLRVETMLLTCAADLRILP